MRKSFLLLFLAFGLMLSFVGCQDEDSDPILTLSSKTAQISAEGGTYSVDVTSNVEYYVNSKVDWITVGEPVDKNGVKTYTLTIAENTSFNQRTGRVTFISHEKVTPQAFDLTQAAIVFNGVKAESVTIKPAGTSASFKIEGDKAWTASVDNDHFVLSPTSGTGDTEVTVTCPANTLPDAVTGIVTIKIGKTTDRVTLIHSGNLLGVLTDWALNDLTDKTGATWVDDAPQTTVGNNDKYVAPSTGKGSIEYYNSDKSAYPIVSGQAACQRLVGGTGDPYCKGTIVGDYWLVTSESPNFEIPAGAEISYAFCANIASATSCKWLLEFKDGTEWKPAQTLTTITETATATTSGAAVTYSKAVSYNIDMPGAYTAFSGSFKTSKAMNSIVLRFRPVGALTNAGLLVDNISSSTSSRFSARNPVLSPKKYDQHVTITIVSVP